MKNKKGRKQRTTKTPQKSYYYLQKKQGIVLFILGIFFISIGFIIVKNHILTFPIHISNSLHQNNYKRNYGLFASGTHIYNASGSIISLRGINWFGFETEDHTVQGLWERSYKDMILQMKQLGFNAVRLPICHDTLQGKPTRYINYEKNPDLAGLNSLQVLDTIIKTFAENGLYIIFDYHSNDCKTIPETPFDTNYSVANWGKDILSLVERYKNVPNVIGIDPKNEPHGKATWGTGGGDTDRKTQVESIGEKILKVRPDMLIFVEGIGESSFCSTDTPHWRGGNLEPFLCTPIDTEKIPLESMVLSPHIYGPSVSKQPYFSTKDFPENMEPIWEKQFGYLASKYTVIPGEFGGSFVGDDKIWQQKFVDYLKKKGIQSFFYWSRNPNSKDTGGIVKDDWKSLEQEKYDNLKRLFP